MKMYNTSAAPRICGECTDMMMRGPVCVVKEQREDTAFRYNTTGTDTTPRYTDCGSADQISDSPLAMVSSPYQGFGNVFDCPMEALRNGTLFEDLYLPIKDAAGPRGKGGCIL